MRGLSDLVQNAAALNGANFSDFRAVESWRDELEVENGKVASVNSSRTIGAGIRVLVQGRWGFASTSDLDKDSLAGAVKRACSMAKACGKISSRSVRLTKESAVVDRWQTPIQIDPFSVTVQEKVNLLMSADSILRKSSEVALAQSSLVFVREHIWIGNSEGSWIDQVLYRTGGGIRAVTVQGSEIQCRSYPAGHGGNYLAGGYEVIDAMKFLSHADQVRDEAVALLNAPICPQGKFDLILEGHQMALQIHESVGHPLELDRVLGMEASFAGRSFVTTDKRGKFEYAAPIVNLVVDNTLPGGLATRGFDDDCVRAQRFPVVREGIFQTYFTNREHATRIEEETSKGCNRADSFNSVPIVRIPNLGLMPGDWKYEDMIADTKDGVLMATNKSWSIDQMRLNFQFGCEIAWEIKNGKIGRILKNPTYQGLTPEFWRSCDAIADADSWKLWGVHNCGKGEPMQVAAMTHANSPARFRKVQLGIR